jgi:hypothetical protein
MNGEVKDGTPYFGTGSKYFTNMYPNLFVLVATDISIEEFSIGGNIGSDGDGVDVAEIFPLSSNGNTYTCYFKCNYDTSDPSINHLIIVPGNGEGITQLYDDSGSYDDHCIQGISGKDKLFFVLFAKENGEQCTTEEATAVGQEFLDVINIAGIQTYEFDLPDPATVPVEGGEGSLDKSIVGGKSIQRNAYITLSVGRKTKVVELVDGQQFNNDFPPFAPNSGVIGSV